jgi:invasion protein IalB
MSAGAEEFLSPKPLVPNKPVSAAKPAAKPAPKPQAGAQVQQAAASPAVKPDNSESVGDWLLQCSPAPARSCQISQRRVNPSNQAMLIWMELARVTAPREATQITVMLPLGLRINSSLGLKADAQPFTSAPIVTCIATGCVHAVELSASDIDALLKTQAITTEVMDLRGQRYGLTISMRGFNDAYLKTALYLRQK